MNIPPHFLAVCASILATAAQASQLYTDDFSQADGAPQGWMVVHSSVEVQDGALRFIPRPDGFDCPDEPTAYVGQSGAATRFESINSISADVSFPGTPTAPDTGDIGGLIFCAQSVKDRCSIDGYLVSFIRGKFVFYRAGRAGGGVEFPVQGPTYQGRWKIELSDTQVAFSVNGLRQFAVDDSALRSGLVGAWCYWYDNHQEMVIDDLEVDHGGSPCSRITPDFPSWRPWYPPLSLAVSVPFGINRLQDYDVTLSSAAPAVARPAGSDSSGALALHFAAGGPSQQVVAIDASGSPGTARFDLVEPAEGCAGASTQVEVLDRRLLSFHDEFAAGDGPPAGWTIRGGSWSVKGGKLVLAPGCNDPPTEGPAIWAGSPPVSFPGARVISASMHLTNSTGSREGRLGGIIFCAREPIGTASFRSGYSITWIDRTEDHGYWLLRNDANSFTMIAGPTFDRFPLGTHWQVSFEGPKIRFRVDGQLVFDVADAAYRGGFFGFTAYCNGTSLEADDVDLADPYATGKVIRVARGASGAADGSSWADAYPELSAALAQSNEGDELWVAGGTYTPGSERSATFLLKAGSGLYGGFAGNEATRELRDPKKNVTVLSGDLAGNDDATRPPGDPLRHDAENSFHVVTLKDVATLDGVTVTGGSADGAGADGDGAGILVAGPGATVSGVEVRQNHARRGSGVYLQAGDGAQFSNALIDENFSEERGTVYCASGSDLVLLNSTIASNLAALGSAGIHAEAGSTQAITNSIAWSDGGGEAVVAEEGASPAIAYSLIEGVQVPSGPGNSNLDPLFRRPARRDDGGTPEDPSDDRWVSGSYKLLEASPAIDSGLASGAPAKDLLGVSRPCGGGIDMGAYEYCEPPDFFVGLPDAEVTLGETLQVRVRLDFDYNPDTPAAAAVEGWSYGVCHDPSILKPVSVSWAGSDTAVLRDGQGPEFAGARLPADLPSGARNGVTVGVVIDTSPPLDATIPAVNGWRDALISYEVLPASVPCARTGDLRTTQLSVCDTLDAPRVRVIMTVNSESLPAAVFDSAAITIRCPTLFRRGDTTRDGFIDISDAICILSGLFGLDPSDACAAKVPDCLRAADINDDGKADITDPIALLNALFGEPPPMPPLTGICQYDATSDGLGCRSYPPCE